MPALILPVTLIVLLALSSYTLECRKLKKLNRALTQGLLDHINETRRELDKHMMYDIVIFNSVLDRHIQSVERYVRITQTKGDDMHAYHTAIKHAVEDYHTIKGFTRGAFATRVSQLPLLKTSVS